MIEVKGLYSKAKIFTDTIDEASLKQVQTLVDNPLSEGESIRMMPDVHAGNGCTIGTTMTVTEKIPPSLVGVDIGCLDKDTEILTPDGWIKISEYDKQEILQYNPENNEGEFIKPLAFIKEECDEFYKFKNSKGLDQVVSEEHNLLVYYGHSKDNLKYYVKNPEFFVDKRSLIKGYYRFNTCFNIRSDGIDISDDLIRIDMMVQADGRIKKYADYNFVEIHLRKERKIDRAKFLLENADIEYNCYILNDGSTNITFHAPTFINKDLSKYYKANFNQLKIVSEECLKWDGHEGYRSFYSSINKENADVIQYSFIATNIRASLYINKTDKPGWNDVYNIIPTKNKYVGYTVEPEIIPSEDGYKYCFTTQLGYFLCRRNGYTFITGNCGMYTVLLDTDEIDFAKLDMIIRLHVPSGFNRRETPHRFIHRTAIDRLLCYDELRDPYGGGDLSLGTLGGGNHFIEIGQNTAEDFILVVHSGSRNIGWAVCNYYQKQAKTEYLKEHKRKAPFYSVEGELFEDYLHDMEIMQDFADLNRKAIVDTILSRYDLGVKDSFVTIHNYIDLDNMILRKGAVSALKDERLLIPLNMRDGSIICKGKGNPDWNYSAPHGAGRLYGRREAKEKFSLTDFKESMRDVYTTCVREDTLDEAPFAYKPMESILNNIGDTVEIEEIIKPVYNFKA